MRKPSASIPPNSLRDPYHTRHGSVREVRGDHAAAIAAGPVQSAGRVEHVVAGPQLPQPVTVQLLNRVRICNVVLCRNEEMADRPPSELYATIAHCRTPAKLVFISRGLLLAFSCDQSRRTDVPSVSDLAIRRTIRRNQLREIVPLADSTIYEMEQRGEFPRRFALSPRCVVWDLAEVEEWLASRRASPVTRAKPPDVRQRRTRPVKAPDRARRAASEGE